MRGTLAPGTPVALSGIARGLDPALAPGRARRGHRAADHRRGTTTPASRRGSGGRTISGVWASTSGPVPWSRPRPPLSAEEADALAADGAIAWDMESAWLARQLPDHPVAVVRAIVEPGTGPAA